MEKLTLIEVLTPIVVAIIGAIWTLISYLIQRANSRSQIYMSFRSQFQQFQDRLPANINQKDSSGAYCYEPDESNKAEYQRLIESFWWLIFDEWFICCKQNKKSCKSLWKKYYAIGVLNALERKEWKEACCRLANANDSFLGQDEEFFKEIDRIYYDAHRIHLFVSPNTR